MADVDDALNQIDDLTATVTVPAEPRIRFTGEAGLLKGLVAARSDMILRALADLERTARAADTIAARWARPPGLRRSRFPYRPIVRRHRG